MRMNEAWEPVNDLGPVPRCALNAVAIWAVRGREIESGVADELEGGL
jgi:hypothetical protein